MTKWQSCHAARVFSLLVAGITVVCSWQAANAVEIISRAEWGAHQPVLPMVRQVPSRITIHHTATMSKKGVPIVTKLRNLQSFSQRTAKLDDGRTKIAWADIPYHFYIAIDGQIAEGRPVGFVGDTNTAYDPTGHISIVVEGNFEREMPSAAELSSLEALVASLASRYAIPADHIGVHRDFASTACPGKNLEGEVRRIADTAGARPK